MSAMARMRINLPKRPIMKPTRSQNHSMWPSLERGAIADDYIWGPAKKIGWAEKIDPPYNRA